MDFALTTEQKDFQASLRRFLAEKWPESELRSALQATTDHESRVWRQLADQLGVPAMTVPEQYGGAGFSQVESSLVLEELGRVLYGGPYFGTVVLAANALLSSTDEQAKEEFLPQLASGRATATLAFADARVRGEEPVAVVANRTSGGWELDGVKDQVVDGASAALVLVTAQTEDGPSLFAVEQTNAVERTPLETTDLTRRMARLTFGGTGARLVGKTGEAEDVLARILGLVSLALAAEAVGGSAKCVSDCVEHANNRVQFGKPIGSFQAVKHACADMQVRLETSVAAVRYSARAAQAEPEQFGLLASVCKTFCTEAYFRTAAATIQLHGGIGFTWDHPAHLHFKRAKSLELFGGSPREHRRKIADTFLGPVR